MSHRSQDCGAQGEAPTVEDKDSVEGGDDPGLVGVPGPVPLG